MRLPDWDEVLPRVFTVPIVAGVCAVSLVTGAGLTYMATLGSAETHAQVVAKLHDETKQAKADIETINADKDKVQQKLDEAVHSATQSGDIVASAQNTLFSTYWSKRDKNADAIGAAVAAKDAFGNPAIANLRPWAVGSVASDLGGSSGHGSVSATWQFVTRYTVSADTFPVQWELRSSNETLLAVANATYDSSTKKFSDVTVRFTTSGVGSYVVPNDAVNAVVNASFDAAGVK